MNPSIQDSTPRPLRVSSLHKALLTDCPGSRTNSTIWHRNRHFVLDDKPLFVYSGEMHYFRIDPTQWEDRIIKAKEAGFNTIASYIPWVFHEPVEGRFDFDGHSDPACNVLRFIDLLQKHQLNFIARVGPVSNGEMVLEGLPPWLIADYPETCLFTKDGKTIHHQGAPAYNSPVFLGKVSAWYDQLLPLLAPRQYPDGNIILFQLCNEIGMVNWLGKMGDYTDSAHELYQQFLATRYPSIAQLNETYASAFSSFSEISQPDNTPDEQQFIRSLDWGDFYREYYAHYFARLTEMVRNHGIRTLLLANIPQFYDFDMRGRGIYSPMTTSLFREFSKLPQTIFGGAYQMRRLDYENFHDIILTSELVRMITADDLPVVCAELQTGILSDRPTLYPADVELNLKTTAMSEVNGVNCYMLAGGVNPPGLGQFGPGHEWQAPLDSAGNQLPHLENLHRFGQFVAQFGDAFVQCSRQHDLTLGFYEPHYKTEYLNGQLADELYGARNEFYYDGLARLLLKAGYQFDVADLERDDLTQRKTLAVSSIRFMAADIQEKLFEFVQQGGNLLIFGDLCLQDERMKPCSRLLDLLQIEGIKRTGIRTIQVMDQPVYAGIQSVTTLSGLRPDDQILALTGETSDGSIQPAEPCGLIRTSGAGTIIATGFHFHDKFNCFTELMDRFCQLAGVTRAVDCGRTGLIAMLRQKSQSGFLYLANFHDQPTAAEICLPGFGAGIRFPITLSNRSGVIIPVNYPLQLESQPGASLHYSTCEILKIENRDHTLTLNIHSATTGEDEIIIHGMQPTRVAIERGQVDYTSMGDHSRIKIQNDSRVRSNWLRLEY